MGKRIVCLLILLFMLGCLFTTAKAEKNPWETCPLLKYPIVERFFTDDTEGYYMFAHDLDNDGRADVLVTYLYMEDEIYELERFWMTGKFGFYFK